MGEIVIHQPPGHTISYFPSLTPLAGSIKAAILLQQIVYLTKRGYAQDTWITKDGGQQEWMRDTGLTLKEFNLALKALETKRLAEHDYHRRSHQLRVRLNIEQYNKAIDELPTDDHLPKHHPKRHMPKEHMPKGKMPTKSSEIAITYDVTLADDSEHMPKGHLPKGKMASAKREDEHMPKGHFVCSKEEEFLEATIQQQEKELEITNVISSSSETEDAAEMVTVQSVFEGWNAICGGEGLMPKKRSLNPALIKQVKLRIKEHPEKAFWEVVFNYCLQTPHYRGENDRHWAVEFDWLMKNEGNCMRLYERGMHELEKGHPEG